MLLKGDASEASEEGGLDRSYGFTWSYGKRRAWGQFFWFQERHGSWRPARGAPKVGTKGRSPQERLSLGVCRSRAALS